MSIGRRTSDNGVSVRQKRFSACATDFPYVADFLVFPALPLHRPRCSEDTEGGRERTPKKGGTHAALTRSTLSHASARPLGGSLPSKMIPARRQSSQ